MSETPVETELAFSYEYAVDINIGTRAAPVWQNIRFISAVDPQATSVTQDGATYDDNGAPHPIKTSESWTLGFTAQGHRLPTTGLYLPEVEKLLELAGPDSVGNAASGQFRWYDDPSDHVPNPNEAYEGDGTVAVTRQNTGNDQIAGWTVTVTGQGRRRKIANPAAEDETP
ncbi:phage tail tube protein [Cellulomonas olei]|uniref:phage tail tube protein n=1 Tax=Cellulomonas sp. P4 TaxID=3142533 RepID=UPI0031BA7AB8